MGKEAFYFPHDFNSRADRKLINLSMKYGMEGIGIFWCIVEMLYEEGGYLPLEYERITFELRTQYDTTESVINDFDLFENDGERFWSSAVLERLQKRYAKSERAKESVNTRWSKTGYERNTNVIRTNEERNTIKERKGKEKKRNNKEHPLPPKGAKGDVVLNFILPEDIDPIVWGAFVEMRKKIRKPLTEHGKKLIVSALQKICVETFASADDILNQSIRNDWQDVYEIKKAGGNGNGGIRTSRSDPSDKSLRTETEVECERIRQNWLKDQPKTPPPSIPRGISEPDDVPRFPSCNA